MGGENRRTCRFEPGLGLEAVSFHGIMQPFANHFHDYYVIGGITGGSRRMGCRNREYALGPGDLVFFSPGVTHACESLDGTPFVYHGFNVPVETMRAAFAAVSGEGGLPWFAVARARDTRLAERQRELALMLGRGNGVRRAEEGVRSFLEAVAGRYCVSAKPDDPLGEGARIRDLCDWMRRHYAEPVTLARLSAVSGMNKFTLLRAFVKTKGITPYRYLEALRVSAARHMLEQGEEPVVAALRAGYADQSHLTRHFKRTTGLTPGQYRKVFRSPLS